MTVFRIGIHISRVAIGLPFLVWLILITGQSHGNGWEHGAIPFEALVKALAFEAPEMRMRAAQSLGARGQPEGVAPLLQCLDKPEKNPLVRSAIYTALGKLRDRRGIPPLTECLTEETREELRSDCVTAIGMIAGKNTLPIILTALKEDSSFLVQSTAVDALGSYSDTRALQRLISLATGSDNRTFRQRAIRALGRTGSPAAVKPLLQALAQSGSDSERALIVSALTGLQSDEAVAPLTTLLGKTEDPTLRTRIVIALGAIRNGGTYQILIEMLQDKVPAVRYFAVKSLHNQGEREAALPISQLSLEISQRLDKVSIRELLTDPVSVLAGLSFEVAALQALTDLNAAERHYPGSSRRLVDLQLETRQRTIKQKLFFPAGQDQPPQAPVGRIDIKKHKIIDCEPFYSVGTRIGDRKQQVFR